MIADDRGELERLGVLLLGTTEKADGWTLDEARILGRWNAPRLDRFVVLVKVSHGRQRRLRLLVVSRSPAGKPMVFQLRSKELHAMDRAMRAAVGEAIGYQVIRPDDDCEERTPAP